MSDLQVWFDLRGLRSPSTMKAQAAAKLRQLFLPCPEVLAHAALALATDFRAEPIGRRRCVVPLQCAVGETPKGANRRRRSNCRPRSTPNCVSSLSVSCGENHLGTPCSR